MKLKRAVITIATGKRVYFDMAIALARSYLLWNKNTDIQFFIVTDRLDELPQDLAKISIMRFKPGELGVGFSMKLKLDQIAPAEQTLFIDADCLCFGSLESVFDRFSGHAVSVIGGSISSGQWFGDIAKICTLFSVSEIPKFNGGVYYLEPGAKATSVYEKARELEHKYDELGLVRLRGSANDELLMSIAMAVEGCSGIEDDGTIHGDVGSCPKLVSLDVLSGQACLYNPEPPDPLYRDWYPARKIRPLVVHCLGDFTVKWPYRAEEKLLQLVMG
ncbi:MAG: hypothetical protein ABI002_00455, partial [Saprospiraceae bacterium]